MHAREPKQPLYEPPRESAAGEAATLVYHRMRCVLWPQVLRLLE